MSEHSTFAQRRKREREGKARFRGELRLNVLAPLQTSRLNFDSELHKFLFSFRRGGEETVTPLRYDGCERNEEGGRRGNWRIWDTGGYTFLDRREGNGGGDSIPGEHRKEGREEGNLKIFFSPSEFIIRYLLS